VWKDSYLKDYSIDKKQFVNKKNEILESYKLKNQEACERGSKIHETLENLFYDKDEKHIRKYAGGGNFTVKKGDYRLDTDRAIYPEFLISYEFDKYLKVSGQVDYLQITDNQVVIRDWKTNRKIDKESYYDKATKSRQMMKYPLTNLQDTNF
jgi:ATP-dependent exoDNAse (exonuclease V) beta subunit